MDKLLKLKSCALLTTGRTGTDLLQSLLDSHPEVLTFNGSFFFLSFWNNSICVSAGKFSLGDVIDEFIGKHVEKLKSRYDIQERKDQLGDNFNQSIDIDLGRFKSEIMNLLDGREVNSKNMMLAIYAAYSICLGQDIKRKKVLFHHLHHIERLENYLKDFPDSQIISMTRDPRANFVSGIEHWRKFRPSTDQGAHLYYYIKRILDDANILEKYGNEYIVIKIEDLGRESALRKLCDWLNISYDECLKKSTWAGLSWHGDSLSTKKKKEPGWSKDMLRNDWETRLNSVDKYVLNFIVFYRLKHYGYSFKRINILSSLIVPFLIFLPLSYELRFFSFSYLRTCVRNKEYKKIIQNIAYYLCRVFLFLRFYLKVIKKKRFDHPLLTSHKPEKD